MNAVKEDVEKLVQKELESANQRFPIFRSDHEGAAVIFEEIEESKSNQINIELVFSHLWKGIKKDMTDINLMGGLKKEAIKLACEAIQVAAMAQKFIDSQKERENDACNKSEQPD